MSAVYIHIPFCERICSYCDFPKRVANKTQMREYLLALKEEIINEGSIPSIDTLYIGGGTPSIIQGDLMPLFDDVIRLFKLNEGYEFTIECNPEHINDELLSFYKSIGVNRISLGVQTFNDRLLKLLNRNHDERVVREGIKKLKSWGFNNISVDLIFSLPMQTLENLYVDLEKFMDLEINHIACYSLILEEKTVMHYLVESNRLKLQENEMEATMYQIVMDTLKGEGFHHYEISNFSKPGFESRHNSTYWLNKEYYGFGMGASGYMNGTRYYKDSMFHVYMDHMKNNQSVIEHQDTLTQDEVIREEMMLGLRLLDGVLIETVNQKYQIDVFDYFKEEIDHLLKQGWIIIDERIRLSQQGLFYGNEVFGIFL